MPENGIHIKGRTRDPSKSGQLRVCSLLVWTHSQSSVWSRSKQAFSCWEAQGWHPQVVTVHAAQRLRTSLSSSPTDNQSAPSPARRDLRFFSKSSLQISSCNRQESLRGLSLADKNEVLQNLPAVSSISDAHRADPTDQWRQTKAANVSAAVLRCCTQPRGFPSSKLGALPR